MYVKNLLGQRPRQAMYIFININTLNRPILILLKNYFGTNSKSYSYIRGEAEGDC